MEPRKIPFSTDFLNKWVTLRLSSEAGDSLPGKGACILARRPFIGVSTALATLFLMLWHRGDHPNTELGATKRDSKEANVFLLAENVQLWNWGMSPLPPEQDRWLGMGEVVRLHGTKGLTGMAATRTYWTCCVSAPPSLCETVPKPPTHISAS